jgi:hypothetical protein
MEGTGGATKHHSHRLLISQPTVTELCPGSYKFFMIRKVRWLLGVRSCVRSTNRFNTALEDHPPSLAWKIRDTKG